MKSDFQSAADIINKLKVQGIPEIGTEWLYRSYKTIEVKPGVSVMGRNSILLPAGKPYALVYHGGGDILFRVSYAEQTGTFEHLIWLCAPKKDTLVGMGEIGDGGYKIEEWAFNKPAGGIDLTEIKNKSLFPHPFYKQIDQVFTTMYLAPNLGTLGITYRSAATADIFEDSTQLVAISGIYQKKGDKGTSGAYLFVVHKFIWKMTNDDDQWDAIKVPFERKYDGAILYHPDRKCSVTPEIMALPQVDQTLKSGTWPLLIREVGGNWTQLPWPGECSGDEHDCTDAH